MKTLISAFLIASVFGAPGYSECIYFRTSTHLLKCAVEDAKALSAADPYPTTPDALEPDEPGKRRFMRATCSCEYSLKGADPRCDVDQSSERTAIVGDESAANLCRRGAALCQDVCPLRLP